MTAIDRGQLEAAIGPNADYYLRRFEAIDAGARWGWNWPSFFLSTAWFAYRGMTGFAVLNFFAPWMAWFLTFILVATLTPVLALPLFLAYLLLVYIVLPFHANALYYRRLKRDFTRATASGELPSPPSGIRKAAAAIAGSVMILLPTVLAGLAQSGYADYTVRSQVSEAVSLLSAAKAPIAEYRAEMRKWPDDLKEIVGNTSGQYVARIEITSGAGAASGPLTITATMKSSGVNLSVAARTVELATEDGENWICRRGSTNGVEDKYLPAACRP